MGGTWQGMVFYYHLSIMFEMVLWITCPTPNSWEVYRIHLLVIVIIVVVVTCKYFQATKQLPSCFNAEYSLQSENIMAPGTLNREMYF